MTGCGYAYKSIERDHVMKWSMEAAKTRFKPGDRIFVRNRPATVVRCIKVDPELVSWRPRPDPIYRYEVELESGATMIVLERDLLRDGPD